MNQILDNNVNGNNDNNGGKKNKIEKNKSNKSSNGGSTPMSDKVVKVFAFLMIVVAVALIASGALSIFNNKKQEEEDKKKSAALNNEVNAEIEADLDEITGKVKIKITSPIVISKMIYSWDQDHDNVVSGEKQTEIEEDIVAPSGEHVLHVQVTDEQNNKTTKDFTFNSATGMDMTSPTITLSITENKKLLVNATDDTSIAYVTYTWNDGEAVTMTPEQANSKEFSFELDIPKGKNTIVVIAVDGSESSNAKTTSKVLEGVTKPEINYAFLDQTGKVLQIMCSHENGIQSIKYTLNGNDYQWKAPDGEEAPKEISFTQESAPGHNEMDIVVTSVDGTKAEFKPVWDYTAGTEAAN